MQPTSRHPFFCIVIPTYNRVELLLETVKQVLSQNFVDYKLIIIDDGSTDQTEKLLREHFPEDDRLNYYFKDHEERGAARNFGFQISACEYVVFFDSDDFMHTDHLSVLYSKIHDHNFPDFIATQFDFVDEKGNHYASDAVKLKESFYDYRLFLNGNPLGCNICVRRI